MLSCVFRKQNVVRMFAAFFVCLMTVLLLSSAVPVLAEENTAKKNVKTHDIAIVFDNSGSMYDNTDRWSQALYAVGVFASMLDYDAGDKLGIYPMGSISMGKDGESVSDRLEITKDNVDRISEIYCQKTSPTILKPAYSAVQYLKKSESDERWLIVLTDGAFFYDKSTSETKSEKDASWLNEKLLALTGSGINLQYLGFAEASSLKSNVSSGFYASNVSDADELTDELVSICNRIFQRNEVQNISGGEFSVDVSMKNVVAFVQGKGAKINSLKNTDTNTSVDISLNAALTAGTEGTGSDYSALRADVSGQVVTFGSCESGSYKLDYTGSNIQIFYEPNVKITSYLTDENGETVDLSEPITPGEYTLNYGLTDYANNKDVTDSRLLKPVELSAVVTNNGSEQTVASGQKIKLEADENTNIKISGTYLSEYEISNESDEQASSVNVKPPDTKELKVSVHTDQFDNWFKLSDKNSWAPIRVDVEYNGEKLTDEQMNSLGFSVEPGSSDDLKYTCTLLSGESAYEIKLGIDENGEYCEPTCGSYKLTAKATYTDEYGREISADDSQSFDIQSFSKFWLWLFWLIIIAAVAALILWWMSRKVLPKAINVDQNCTGYTLNYSPLEMSYERPSYSRKAKTLAILTPLGVQVPLSVTCKLKAVDRRWTKSKNRRMQVDTILNTNAETVNIAGGVYQYEDGKFEKGPTIAPTLSNSVIKLERTDVEGNTAEFRYKIKRM